jgi:carbamoyltransferase
MTDRPVVLGINRTTDASICLIGGSQFLYSIQKERVTRRKHDRGTTGDLQNYYLARAPHLREPIDLVV